MRVFIFLFFFISSLNFVYSQHKINLDPEKIDITDKAFQIVEVQDWRSNKSYIGVVYRGMANNPKAVTIEGDVAEKIRGMIQQNVDHDDKLIIGLRKLEIKEVIKTTAEFGFAEVEIHAAKKFNEGYSNLGVYRNTLKYTQDLDVTSMHAESIALALKGVLDQISLEIKNNEIVSLEELKRQQIDVKWTELPVINLEKINKGLYLNFTSLRSNKPDSVVNFQIRGGKKPMLYLKNEKGRFKKHEGIPYYIAANDGGVYIGFENNYFRTTVRNGKWLFVGPKRSDIEAINTGILAAGLIGGGIVGAAAKDQFIYQINTLDGSIRAVDKIR